MKKILFTTLLLIGIGLLAGCAGIQPAPIPTPTPNAGELALSMMKDQLAAKATQNFVDIQFTATAQIIGATATQKAFEVEAASTQQARVDAQATADQKRADARATQQRMDMEATQEQGKRNQQATATHEAFIANQLATQRSFEVTSTSQSIGTQTAYPQTATAQSIYTTQTQVAWQTTATMDAAFGVAQATAAYADAQSVELGIQREKVTNMTRAWVPWMGFVIVLGVLSVVALRISRMRVVQKDAFGSMPGLVIDGAAVDMDSGMSARVLKDGSVKFKQLNDKITEREQKVRIVRALPAGRPDVPTFLLEDPRKTPVIEVVEPSNMSRMMLDEIQDQIVEEE